MKPSSVFLDLIQAAMGQKITPQALHLFASSMDSPEYRQGTAVGDGFTETVTKQGEELGHVVLVSGGADSTTCYRLASNTGKPVKPIYVNMGQPYAGDEITVVESVLGIKGLEVIDTRRIYGESSPYKHIMPGRNLVCLDIAAQVARPGWAVWFGVVAGETPVVGGDKSVRFLQGVDYYLSQTYGVRLNTLRNRTKAEWARWWLKTQPDPERLLLTVTCYNWDGIKHCGTCQGCLRRYCALALAGYDEQAIFNGYYKHPLYAAKEAKQKYLDAMWAELHGGASHYGFNRCSQMLTILMGDRLPTEFQWEWKETDDTETS